MNKINLPEKFAFFSERWSPKVIAALNDYQLKIARIEGELIVVPKGVLHRPHAEDEAKILMIEPAGTLNTGDVRNEFTQSETDWI